uniref:Lactase-phlorizin hydrolase-like n=1 Tax=Scophthalmus maximus TaxID=52904 RepID=A0A8D2ZRL2_SCOMX
MKNLLWLVCLYVLCLRECWSSEVNGQESFMLLAGPLPKQLVRGSGSGVNDAFDCSHPIPPGSRQYFEYLQSRGVTHFEVQLSWAQLLPTGRPSQPQQAVVTCYRSLLRQLLEVGLQPLVVLHGSTLPQALGSRYGGWESQELVDMFQQYAEFAFQEFGALAHSWLSLSDLGTVWHDWEHAVYNNILFCISCLEQMDFLSIHIEYNCVSSTFAFHITLQTCACYAMLYFFMLFYDYLLSKTDSIPGYSGTTETRNSYESVWDMFKAQTTSERDLLLKDAFPADFQWATSSESFKVEGGWSEGGKGETIWDRFGHKGLAFANQTADLACDSFHKVDYDVYLLRGLHVNTYQFSISWARIFPSGHRGSQSENGILYYDKLINALIESGIQPVVTLYHWDLPQALQDHGGWTNTSIVEAFKDYADFCFSRFGDRVKTWNTFSSPWVVSHVGYGSGEHPPGIMDLVVASYQATHNILKSHAEAWHVYNDKYRRKLGGKVGIALNSDWAEPMDPSSPEDIAAADHYLQFMLGWFAHPIFVDGDYPATLKTQIEEKRRECPDSEPARLPVFTPQERKRIHGTADFLGLNHYTSRLVNSSNGGCTPGPQGVGDFQTHVDPSWSSTASDWIYSTPWGLRRLLNYISTEYLNVTKVPIYITGNGMPTEYSGDTLNDTDRIEYMRSYINEALKGNAVGRLKHLNCLQIECPQCHLPLSHHKLRMSGGNSQTKLIFRENSTTMVPSQGFSWGVSSSAYQIEGGWNADGKGPSIWDTFTHITGNIPGNPNGDVACDSYHRLDEDLYMLRALRVKSYRFSLSWPRIFPDGQRTSLNQKGVDYYNRLIDGLLAYNITPMVTLYHWDLPQALQNISGWDNVDMIDIFNDFCDFCFATFGNRVQFWMTFNQPHTIAWSGYGLGQIPPNVKNPGIAPYRVAHNLIKAHAKAYHTYDDKYRKSQGGQVSIALNADWIEPKDVTVPREVVAADRALQFQLGWFAHPIFKNGDYPDAMKWHVGNKSELQGLSESRLPTFTEEEKSFIRGTADMFCVNHYTTRIANHATLRLKPQSYEYDRDLSEAEEGDSPTTAINGQRAVAWGLRRLLNWIREEYGDPEIYISENGVATKSKMTADDFARVFYLKTYIDEALKAYDIDGVKVKGFIATSLMDSFEWLNGYKIGFGLHHVDFTNANRPRTPKYSAHYYYQVIKDNGFPIPDDEKMLYGHFRKDFIWSTATASYQIEGGWRADGKGLSIWDKFAHTPLRVFNDDNGDIACDSYNKVEEDVAILKQLKVTHYRFSISWSRVLPNGTTNHINEAGLNYYHRLVDALLAANIQPHITLYHWDLPQALQDIGGWENENIIFKFRDYADFIFSRLGHKVKFWITINEPYNIANIGHGYGAAAPGISLRPGTLPYIVGHNLIKAHAEAWHLYNDNYRAKQKGIISITINSDWSEPRNPYKQEDYDAAKRVVQFYIGWFAHPIFNGDYSDTMKTIIRERSLAGGLLKSRLPEFSPEEIKRVKGTYDYFGFNHYTTVLAFPVDYGNLQHYDADRGAGTIADRTWLDSGSSWLKVSPFGFRRILNFIKEEYGNPPIIVTENGMSERGPVDLNDIHRSYYYEKYINQLLKAYLLDGVDIRGYTAWSLMDNLEWATGFSERFGLFYVNRSDRSLPRVAKSSVAVYSTIINCNGFPDPASGPHECLIPGPEGTSSPITDDTVKFLGINLSTSDAEAGLYTTFALLIVAVFGAICSGFCFLWIRKQSKTKRYVETLKMERRF